MTAADALAILAMAAAVYLPKALPLVLVADRLAPAVRAWLRYVAPAVLAALVAPAVLAPERVVAAPSIAQAPFLATLVVAIATRRMLPSLAVGLAAVLVVSSLGRPG